MKIELRIGWWCSTIPERIVCIELAGDVELQEEIYEHLKTFKPKKEEENFDFEIR